MYGPAFMIEVTSFVRDSASDVDTRSSEGTSSRFSVSSDRSFRSI